MFTLSRSLSRHFHLFFLHLFVISLSLRCATNDYFAVAHSHRMKYWIGFICASRALSHIVDRIYKYFPWQPKTLTGPLWLRDGCALARTIILEFQLRKHYASRRWWSRSVTAIGILQHITMLWHRCVLEAHKVCAKWNDAFDKNRSIDWRERQNVRMKETGREWKRTQTGAIQINHFIECEHTHNTRR